MTTSAINYSEDTVVASSARTASGNSSTITGYGSFSTLRAQLNVSAASGTTPTLDVVIEDSLDGKHWNAVGAFAPSTTPSNQTINVITPFADRIRVCWTVAGTAPSFTFSVDLAAHSAPRRIRNAVKETP